jgi:hypothetical protein
MDFIRNILFYGMASILLAPGAFAAGGQPAVIAEVASRQCVLAATGAEAGSVIQSMKVRTNGNALEQNVIASALKTLSVRSKGGLDKNFSNLTVNVQGALSTNGGTLSVAGMATASRVTLSQAEIDKAAASSTRAAAEAMVVHEFGHVVARRSNLQGAYDAQVPDCNISTYCTCQISNSGAPGKVHGHRREEFAEVFTAYIFDAGRLKSQCPEAYAFMQKKVFKNLDSEAPATANTCAAANVSRAYATTDGRVQPLPGGSDAPAGSQALTGVGGGGSGPGIDLSQLFIPLQSLVAREQQQSQAQEKATTTPASTGQGTKVAPEWKPDLGSGGTR